MNGWPHDECPRNSGGAGVSSADVSSGGPAAGNGAVSPDTSGLGNLDRQGLRASECRRADCPQSRHHGKLACDICGTRLFGRTSPVDKTVRMFQLPAEPLYLAACFRYVPASLLRFVQLPFNALLVFAVTYVAQKLPGTPGCGLRRRGRYSRTLRLPIHGPVSDNTVHRRLSFVWTVFAFSWPN